MKFRDFQEEMKRNPEMKVSRIIWTDIYIYWSERNQVFYAHTPSSDRVWDWNGETTIYEDLNADDWFRC